MNSTVEPPGEEAISDRFDFLMGVWFPAIICTLGIVGNAVSLVVLSSDRSKCPTFYSLKALALCDILLLTAALFQQVIPLFCLLIQCTNTFCRNLGYLRVYAWPIICIAQMNSIWLTVFISAERYAAICRPLHSKSMRNVPRVRIAICLITVCSVVFNIPKFFEFRVEHEFNEEFNATFVIVGDTALRHHTLYRYLYNTALYCLVIYAFPLTTLTLLNLMIVVRMRQAGRQWEQLNRLQQRELKATAIPLCIVFVFFICGTQSLISFILDAVFVHSTSKQLQIYTAVVNLLVMFNSAVNFVIFYLFGSKFRKLLRHVVFCKLNSQIGRTGSQETPILRMRFRGNSQCSCSTNGQALSFL